jgi:hypothetical protein
MNTPQISQVKEGMKVFDRDGKEIGSVEEVYLGAVSPLADDLGRGPQQTDAPMPAQQGTIIDDLARGMGSDEELPDVVRARLLRSGFIRISASGLFSGERYAIPEQIEAVLNDRVKLKSLKDDLIKV